MRRILPALVGVVLLAQPATAQNADDIVAKYINAVGGMGKIQAVQSLRRTGRYIEGGGFEAAVMQENKRGNMVREEFVIQNLTGVNAYDGKTGWKIVPWQGKKDAESLGEEEMKSILEDSDFDGPLVNYQKKGNKVEFAGKDDFEGSEVYKLKVTLPNGDGYIYFMDADAYVPIKIEIRRMVRGAERNYEVALGDYKQVDGWYLPYFTETNEKGSSDKSQTVYDTIEANVQIADARFHKPTAPQAQEAKP